MEEGVGNCDTHGFYSGSACPICGSRGKYLLYPDEVEGLGRIMAGILRHFPDKYGIKLSKSGFAHIYSMVPAIKAQKHRYGFITPLHIEAIGKTDRKGRYEVNEDGDIRATYDHTIPIDLSDLPTDHIPELLFYQTTEEEFSILKETGISPSDKTYIHLSDTFRKAYVSGMFHADRPLIIGINAHDLNLTEAVYRASNEVFLTKNIPPEFIVSINQQEVNLTENEKEEIRNFKIRMERKLLGERRY